MEAGAKRAIQLAVGGILAVVGFVGAYWNEDVAFIIYCVGLGMLGWGLVRLWKPKSRWIAGGAAFAMIIVLFGGAHDLMPWHPFGNENQAEHDARIAREQAAATAAAQRQADQQATEAQRAAEKQREADQRASENRYFLLTKWTNEGYETVDFYVGTYDGTEIYKADSARATAQESSSWHDEMKVPCTDDFSHIVVVTKTVDGDPITKRDFYNLACKGGDAPYTLRLTASGRISLGGFNADQSS